MEHKIRVFGYVDCKWYIDPPIKDIKSHQKFRMARDPIDLSVVKTLIFSTIM